MQVKELILKKRDGLEHTSSEIEWLIRSYLEDEIQDYHVAAWLMAVFFKGLSKNETRELTRVMWHSGQTLSRKHRFDRWIDKHSTGGVGDKPSLILVPLVNAVCQRLFGKGKVKIPMISGRGLGHTSGTLDKLESVPGFKASLRIEKALDLLEQHGFFMMGQTQSLVPADRRLYALRDATATVECIPLIVASIMCKKLSENLDGLVFDVKCGAGAFLSSYDTARSLAVQLSEVAKSSGIDVCTFLTSMDEPLGWKVGHLLEVEESFDFVRGLNLEAGLKEVVMELGAAMVHLASSRKVDLVKAKELCEKEIGSDLLVSRFRAMFECQGGDWAAFEKESQDKESLCKTWVLKTSNEGYLSRLDPRALGVLLNALGGGRNELKEGIDKYVGFEILKKVGDEVKREEPVLKVFYRNEEQLEGIEKSLSSVLSVSGEPISKRSWILERWV